jgi:tripartite-type tricarboxylate transporter receptor subunit TctC
MHMRRLNHQRMIMNRLRACLLFALATWAVGVAAQYPTKPVTIVVPFAAGGGGDIITRLVAQKLAENTGKSFLVENRTGAGGRIGTAAAVKAPPDGYTLVFIDRAYVMMRPLYGDRLPWPAASDPIPVTILSRAPFLIVVSPRVNVTTLQQFIERAQKDPGSLNYGTSGVGSVNHVMGELFSREANIRLTHIPYKGMGDAITGMLGGSIDLLVVGSAPVSAHIEGKRMVALAVASERRLSALPSVPSVVEAGLPGYLADNWFGLAAPNGTPKEVVEWLQREVVKALAAPDVRSRLAADGIEPGGITPEAFAEVLREDTRRFSEVIKAAGITAE